MKRTQDKINLIEGIIDNLERMDSELKEFNWYDCKTGEFDSVVFNQYLTKQADYDKEFKRLKNYIKSLADDLGFRIKEVKFPRLLSTWCDIFTDIRWRWNDAMKHLYSFLYYSDRIEKA